MPEYERYTRLKFERPESRVLEITLMGHGRANTLDAAAHAELVHIWRDIDADPDVNCVIVRGPDAAFSAGGDLSVVEAVARDYNKLMALWKEGRDIVYNVINCGKPIVSAVRGPAVGAGLAIALLSDVSIAGRTARIIDGHTKLGVAAGDHAAIVWPLLCGLAKAKYYLLLCETITGEEAERLGMVSLCVDDDKVYDTARETASRLAAMAPTAVRMTKYALNNWLRMAGPIFDTSIALETLNFLGPELQEGVAAFRERRPPRFNPHSAV
jgi:enoyl-CoA hydratase